MSQNLQKPADIPTQVLNPFRASKKYSYQLIEAAADLTDYVDSHWAMHWDLGDRLPFKLQIASSPYVAITFTQYGCFVTGISTGIYTYTISGTGSLYGTLFKPEGFHQFYNQPLVTLTDKELPAGMVLKDFDDSLNNQVLGVDSDIDAILIIEDVLRKTPPIYDPNTALVSSIIAYATANPTESTTQLAKKYAMSERKLQELFQKYVGVGRKWICMRERLQKALDVAARSTAKPIWTEIAQELNYGDQSHFINDFKRVIGMSPNRYYQLLLRSR